MKMHTAIQHVVDWLTSEIAMTPSNAEIDAHLASVWDTHGPGDHGYSAEFRRIARRLLAYFVSTRAGFTRWTPDESRVVIGGRARAICSEQSLHARSGATW